MPNPPGSGEPIHWKDHREHRGEPVGPDAWLSQYGRAEGHGSIDFRERPRFDQLNPAEFDLSMSLGQRSAAEMGLAVRSMPAPERIRKRDRVRWFIAGDLIEAGYVVVLTPTRRNPEHVSVLAPMPDDLRSDLRANLEWWWSSRRVTLESLVKGIGGDSE
jgi:hypothetical protein